MDGGHAAHAGIRRHVLVDQRTWIDDGSGSDRHARQNRTASAEPYAGSDVHRRTLNRAGAMLANIELVSAGQDHHAWANGHSIADGDAFLEIEHAVRLDCTTLADDEIREKRVTAVDFRGRRERRVFTHLEPC